LIADFPFAEEGLQDLKNLIETLIHQILYVRTFLLFRL
jgi:hypothetical protein